MSGSFPPGATLRIRSAPGRVQFGNSVTLWLDLRDSVGQPIDVIAVGMAYTRPDLSDFESRDVPLVPTKTGPGTWLATFIPEMQGTFRVWAFVPGGPAQTETTIDVMTGGEP
ncbi:hypothetical protein [Pseudoroseomonas cervicalis]|uniref:hypothetical protein n=1 Tax=Teichococcus cervicalis TaxID=204525 RepID=UPI002780C75A|nr:hypothetical protein [Pseudoroseomonas cervicalis]MDQ1081456.1 hypothetical protein [Pseudoroseomonas cervicalis]